jgi:hypothetical protein
MSASPRQFHTQQIHFLRKSITYSDCGTTVTVGVIPAGSVFIKPASGVAVTTLFNNSNVLDIGPSTDTGTNLWATSLDINGALGFVPCDEAVTSLVTVDTIVQCIASSTATVGAAEVIICYIPDIDG